MDVSERAALARNRPFGVVVGFVGVVLLLDLVVGVAAGRYATSALGAYVRDGPVTGLIIGVVAIGTSMTYSILNFASFAHGDLVTTGAFTGSMAAFLVAGYGRFPAGQLFHVGGRTGLDVRDLGISIPATPAAVLVGIVVAAAGTVLVALAVDRLVFRPMREIGAIPLLVASIGVALALRYLIVFVFQAGSRGPTAGNLVPGTRSRWVPAPSSVVVVSPPSAPPPPSPPAQPASPAPPAPLMTSLRRIVGVVVSASDSRCRATGRVGLGIKK